MTNAPRRDVCDHEFDEAPELARRRIISQDQAFTAAMQASGRSVTGPSKAPGTERAQFSTRPETHAFAKGWGI